MTVNSTTSAVSGSLVKTALHLDHNISQFNVSNTRNVALSFLHVVQAPLGRPLGSAGGDTRLRLDGAPSREALVSSTLERRLALDI